MSESTAHAALQRALQHATAYLDALDSTPVAATASPAQLRARLARSLQDEGLDAARVLDELVADCEGGLTGSAGGRFFGWVIGGSLPAALAADWLTSAWDQNAGLHATSPAAGIVEEVCGAWLKELLGLPASASFALVTGCQMSHLTCLAAARHHLLAARNWDVERCGLAGSEPIRLLTGEHRHGSIERALRFLGLGSDCVVDLPLDAQGRLDGRAVEAAFAARRCPTILLLQAGDINTGAFEDFNHVIPLAHTNAAWVHVDGAFGLWAAASPKYRHLLAGVEQADSWSTDGHKWLNVPFDCGYAFVTHPESHRAAMAHHASYLTHAADARDAMDWNPEWSRRARGFASYAAIRQLGRRGLADLIDRSCAHAQELGTRIGQMPGAKLLRTVQLNQALVRFYDPSPTATEQDHDRRTDQVMASVLRSGEAFFTGTNWQGQRCMRISVCSWQTTQGDIERSLAAIAAAMR